MDIIRSGWVLQLRPVAISWLSAQPIHARGGTLELLATYVPDLERVAVLASIGNSDR